MFYDVSVRKSNTAYGWSVIRQLAYRVTGSKPLIRERMIWLYAYWMVNQGHADKTVQRLQSEGEKSLFLVMSKTRSMSHSPYAYAGLQMSQLLSYPAFK